MGEKEEMLEAMGKKEGSEEALEAMVEKGGSEEALESMGEKWGTVLRKPSFCLLKMYMLYLFLGWEQQGDWVSEELDSMAGG